MLQRFVTPARGDLMVALLGGLYSSTATTVVLARAAAAKPATNSVAQAGIILATALMYLRILVIVAIFDLPLALGIAPATILLSLAGVGMAALQYRRARRVNTGAEKAKTGPRNPLELTAAAVFAVLFVVTSIATQWAQSRFGALGVNVLAAVVGFVDIDPFVLNMAQSGPGSLPLDGLISAVLIAMSSNNVLKAVYATIFAGWRASLPAATALLILAAGGVGAALIH
ncbi:MAG: DUF4010 domain-containing protein [Stellaceae bacterium]